MGYRVLFLKQIENSFRIKLGNPKKKEVDVYTVLERKLSWKHENGIQILRKEKKKRLFSSWAETYKRPIQQALLFFEWLLSLGAIEKRAQNLDKNQRYLVSLSVSFLHFSQPLTYYKYSENDNYIILKDEKKLHQHAKHQLNRANCSVIFKTFGKMSFFFFTSMT